MMKKMNKKLLGSLILGLMLSAPVSQVNAIQLNRGGIYGTGDSYSADPNIVTKDGNTLTYNFDGEESTLKFTTRYPTGQTGAIFINEQNVDDDFNTLKINDPLNIEFDLQNNSGAVNGIAITRGPKKTIDRREGGDITIKSPNDSGYTFTSIRGAWIAAAESEIYLGNGNITIETKDAENGLGIGALDISGCEGSTIYMGDGEIKITGNVQSNNQRNQVLGFHVKGTENKIDSGNVSMDIEVTGDNDTATTNLVYGVYAVDGGKVITGDGDIKVAAINPAGGTVNSYGIFAFNGGTATEEDYDITKKGGDITVIAEGKGTVQAMGVANSSSTVNLGLANIKVQATGDGNTVASKGLYTIGNGTIIYAGGQIDAVAYNSDGVTYNEQANVSAIQARDSSAIKVNEHSKNKVVINGDVDTTNDGKVYLNLNTADSVLNGAVDDEHGIFKLEDGAQWKVLGTSTVNDFRMKNGIIHMDRNYDVNIALYSGSGTISFQAKDVAADGVANFKNVGNVTIENAKEGASVTLGIANDKIDTLDLEKTEENLNALAKKISYKANDGNLTGKAVIREGLITPEASGDLVFSTTGNSVTNITGGDRTTKTMYAMKNLAATAIVAWRQEDSTFSQRLGELRESTGGQGIWARMSRGEFEYDGEYKNQYNFFQLGYDWASDNWHYGVAVSHNDGETAYTYGSGENRSTSLSLYGTWLGDAGHYTDIVLKQGRLSNDFDVYTSAGHTSGDYDAWGTSLSGEYGKKILLENDWYVTPQAQLTLMRIGGEDYDTNNGIHVRQDTLYSAVGRLGFELGRKLDEKGSVYAKASVLHDFAGNAETYLSCNGFTNSYSQDLSDTWFEAGLGFNYRTGDNSYIYADVVRTFGGDVETPWQWNIGMRWSC